jgi:hypothetical protein
VLLLYNQTETDYLDDQPEAIVWIGDKVVAAAKCDGLGALPAERSQWVAFDYYTKPGGHCHHNVVHACHSPETWYVPANLDAFRSASREARQASYSTPKRLHLMCW